MVTNTVWKWGVPKWDFFACLPILIWGVPIWKRELYFLSSIESCSAGASLKVLTKKPIPSHLSLYLNPILDVLPFWQTNIPKVLFTHVHTHDFSMMRYSVRKQKVSFLTLWLPVSIKGFPFGNGDSTHPHMETVNHLSIWGIKRCGCPFPHGDSHMETGD